jgi:hypothetical protein
MIAEMPEGETQPAELVARVQEVNQQAAQIQSSAKSFAAAAGKGFHIDPQAAATLINSCRDSITELEQMQVQLFDLRTPPPLGQTPAANKVAPFTLQVATDNEGIFPAIQNLVSTLQDMIKAYQNASTNYAETEALVQQAMNTNQHMLA